MYRKYFIQLLFITTVLSGCNELNIQPSATTTDLGEYLEIQNRANEAYQKEDWKNAEKDYKLLTQKTPGDVEPWFRLGNIYARTNNLDMAVSAYREALVRDQKNSKIWHNLGIVQLKQATNTFIEMVEYTDINDPLNKRARIYVNGMEDLMAAGVTDTEIK